MAESTLTVYRELLDEEVSAAADALARVPATPPAD
jgi:hypothetical protein